jgi:hypothetical protein
MFSNILFSCPKVVVHFYLHILHTSFSAFTFLSRHDCGVFQMKALELFDPTKDLRKEFSKADITHLRIQYANRLFFHSGNKADRSLVTNFYVKVEILFFLYLMVSSFSEHCYFF